MERFTERDEFGNADIIGVDSMDLQCNLAFDEFNKVTNALNKLAEYEDLEEQGKLVRLPCKVGDKVYAIELDEENFTQFHAPRKISEYEFTLEMFSLLELFGKCIFLTKEESEAALKEMTANDLSENINEIPYNGDNIGGHD